MGKGTLAAAFSLSIVATLVTVDAQVGSRRLTVDDIYSPSRRVNFSGAVDTSITWLDASTYLTRRRTRERSRVDQGRCGVGSHLAVVRCRPNGGRARVASRCDARRSIGNRALERPHVQPCTHRSAGHDRRRSLLLLVLIGEGREAHERIRRRGSPELQS